MFYSVIPAWCPGLADCIFSILSALIKSPVGPRCRIQKPDAVGKYALFATLAIMLVFNSMFEND